MDKHTLTLILGILLATIGAFMAFYENYYSSNWWTSKASHNPLGPERAKRLAKFQGLVVMCMGIGCLYLAFFR